MFATRRNFVNLTFMSNKGTVLKQANPLNGETLLQAAHNVNLDVEGACGGQCACATCHMILDEGLYKQLKPPSDDEADMLDLAADVTKTSRLGCQVKVCNLFEGAEIRLPSIVVNQLD